jgi:hypothetical protein
MHEGHLPNIIVTFDPPVRWIKQLHTNLQSNNFIFNIKKFQWS